MVWKKLSPTEITLAKKWYLEDDLSATQIAKRLGRSASTISRLVVKKVACKPQGRKPLLTRGHGGQVGEEVGAADSEEVAASTKSQSPC